MLSGGSRSHSSPFHELLFDSETNVAWNREIKKEQKKVKHCPQSKSKAIPKIFIYLVQLDVKRWFTVDGF